MVFQTPVKIKSNDEMMFLKCTTNENNQTKVNKGYHYCNEICCS